MTDSRLQELKRAWEASQSVEDEAAYLRERVRAGDLTQERLAYAAALGFAPAERSRVEPAELPINWKDQLTHGVSLLSHAEAVLWACEVAESALTRSWDVDDVRPAKAIEAAREWARCPCDRHAKEVERVWLEADLASGSYRTPPSAEELAQADPQITTPRGLREVALICSARAASRAALSVLKRSRAFEAAKFARGATGTESPEALVVLAKWLCR